VINPDIRENLQEYLKRASIQRLERKYLTYFKKNPFPNLRHKSIPEILNKLKRLKYNIGPYENITVFEASNRIATDLTLFKGIEKLFAMNEIPKDSKVLIQLGNMQMKGKGDFSVKGKILDLEGEVFDTAPSFFNNKLYKVLAKWKDNPNLRFIIFNESVFMEERCKRYFMNKQTEYRKMIFCPVQSWQ